MILVLHCSGSRSSSKVPRLVLPEELFVNIAISIGAEINQGLEFIQDVSCGGNLKQFLVVCLYVRMFFKLRKYICMSVVKLDVNDSDTSALTAGFAL